MAFLHEQRGPAAFAQLIGGEVSLLSAQDHALALEAMHAHGRRPMSMTHGDFDEQYLRDVVLPQRERIVRQGIHPPANGNIQHLHGQGRDEARAAVERKVAGLER